MTKIAASEDPQPEQPEFLDEKLRTAWERYGRLIYALIAIVALAIIAKERQLSCCMEQEGTCSKKGLCGCDDARRLPAVCGGAQGAPWRRRSSSFKFADESYLDWKFAEAVSGYTKAVADLPAGPFQDRAKLGLAMSQVRDGKSADGEAALRLILNDESQLKTIRCEAGYDLADIAASTGRLDEVQKLAERLAHRSTRRTPFPSGPFALRSENAAAASGAAVAAPGH